MKNELLLILDSGHGGIINDKYTTAPAKMYEHSDKSIAYEGVINRRLKKFLIYYWSMDSKPYYDVSAGPLDISLINRITFANSVIRQFQYHYEPYYLSLHSNAGKGTGIEGYTTKGKTGSDLIMTYILDELKLEHPDIKFRMDLTDSDPDKEADYYVIRRTVCKAGLLELMFFDNPTDWELLQKDDFLDRSAYAIYKALCNYEKNEL